MPRLRTIKPGFFTDDELGECAPLARLLYAGLWCHADREGRLEDRPRRLKVEVLPYDDCDVDALLDQLATHGFIIRYQVGGIRYIAIPKFLAHQNPHVKEAASTIPAPPEHDICLPINKGEHQASTMQAPDEHSASNRTSRAGIVFGEWGVGSGLGNGHPTTASQSTGVAPDADAPAAPLALRAAPKPAGASDHQALWDTFTELFGTARSQKERDKRGKACREARESSPPIKPEEVLAAAENWPNVMGDATMSELAIVANLGKLLEGPQRHGRSNGTVRGVKQTVYESAAVHHRPSVADLRKGRSDGRDG